MSRKRDIVERLQVLANGCRALRQLDIERRGAEPLADLLCTAASEIKALRAIRDATRDLLDNHETNGRHMRLAEALDAYDRRGL